MSISWNETVGSLDQLRETALQARDYL